MSQDDAHLVEFINGRRSCPVISGNPGQPLNVPNVACSERYAVEVTCGDRKFLFTRHDLGNNRMFETFVRHRMLHEPYYSNASISLPHYLLMSHNAVVHCVQGRTLVAYGGQAHAPGSPDWQGNDRGIWRVAAPATALPLRWSAPQLVRSGDTNVTGCVDLLREGPDCEYDGKLSVVRFRRSVLLFTRSNLLLGGGGRHVQVSRSANGVVGWSRFEQLEFSGVTLGTREVNIYFLTVRAVRLRAGNKRHAALVGIFPGVLNEPFGAGIFLTTSLDGVRWSRPRKLLASQADGDRTRDHPVDGAVPGSWWSPITSSATHVIESTSKRNAYTRVAGQLELMLQVDVDLRTARVPSMDDNCDASIGRPLFCSYQLAWLAPQETAASSFAIRKYLQAVYPAAHGHLEGVNEATLIRLYEGLDYYYSGTLCSLRPSVPQHVCMQPRASIRDNSSTISLPYLPAGAYFHANNPPTAGKLLRPFTEASLIRHATPVRSHARPATMRVFSSSFGAKLGPAPAWTSPLAAVRYVLHPVGLRASQSVEAALPAESQDVKHWHGIGSRARHAPPASSSSDSTASLAFDLRRHPRVLELFALRDGDALEVEQWGGWAAENCPPICGLWANIWKGTGLAMRVTNPFVSFSKATAVVEMILKLGARSSTVLVDFATSTTLIESARALQAAHVGTPLAVCVASALLRYKPCSAADGEQPARHAMERWLAFSRNATPLELLEAFSQLTNGSSVHMAVTNSTQELSDLRRFVLHWLYGVCGVGEPLKHTGYGWDGLLAILACMLGHHTIILAASANDNGLIHQELVDFEVPQPHGWPPLSSSSSPPNPLRLCRRPFASFQEDAASGSAAKQARRRELLTFWRSNTAHGPKFVLPRHVGSSGKPGDMLKPTVSEQHAASCKLHFGPSLDEPSGEVEACQVTGEDEELPPTAAKACWAWCKGALSQRHAQVSLLQVLGTVTSSTITSHEAKHSAKRPGHAPSTNEAHRTSRSHAASQEAVLRYSGYCDLAWGESNCELDSKGTWPVGPTKSIGSLSDCRLACRQCTNCNFVSYSASARMCSWYQTCSMPLLHSPDGSPFTTMQVGKAWLAAPVDFHVHPLAKDAQDAVWDAARLGSAARRFAHHNTSSLCRIHEKSRFGLVSKPDILGPRHQVLGRCIPTIQTFTGRMETADRSAVDTCCALCSDTLGCAAWTLLPGGECCMRRWAPEGIVRDVTSTAGLVRSPCKVDCALPYRSFGKETARLPTASAEEIPWLRVGRPAPDAGIRHGVSDTTARMDRIAVCMAGQVRTLVHPAVTRALNEHLLDRHRHDLFAVLSTGTDTRPLSSLKVPDDRLPQPCDLEDALRYLRPLRTRFVLNSHNGREPCPQNRATIQMVATASCVSLVEEYERDRGKPRLYKYMLRTRPDLYWKTPVRLEALTSKLAWHRTVLTTNDWNMLAHRALWPILRDLANVTCDERCDGRQQLYLGSFFDDMNEYCLFLLHLAKHGVDHIEASHPTEGGIYHYAADSSPGGRQSAWLHTMHYSNSPLVRWRQPPPQRRAGTRIICQGPPPSCSFCGGDHPPCPSDAAEMHLPRKRPASLGLRRMDVANRLGVTDLQSMAPESGVAYNESLDPALTHVYVDYRASSRWPHAEQWISSCKRQPSQDAHAQRPCRSMVITARSDGHCGDPIILVNESNQGCSQITSEAASHLHEVKGFVTFVTCTSHLDCIDAGLRTSFCDDNRHCSRCTQWNPNDPSASVDGRHPPACNHNSSMLRQSTLGLEDYASLNPLWPVAALSQPMTVCTSCRTSRLHAAAVGVCPAVTHATQGRPMQLFDTDCTERYAELVRCAGRTWLFSRIEHFDSRQDAREAQPHTQLIARELVSRNVSGDIRTRQVTFGTAWLAFADDKPLKVASNAAVSCTDDGHLLLHGGGEAGAGVAWLVGRQPQSTLLLGRKAPTSKLVARVDGERFQWSAPVIAWSGNASKTQCIDARPHMRGVCEFDGKLSIVRFQGRVLAFTRSNLHGHGGRHVQVAFSHTGIDGWSSFQQLVVEQYATQAWNNIYFASVRTVPTGHAACDQVLLGLFPASIDGRGGVFVSVSSDGVRWGAFRLIMESEVHASWRTADHPVGGSVAPTNATELSIVLEHGVSVPRRRSQTSWPGEEPNDERAQAWCAAERVPLYCEYTFTWRAQRLNASHVAIQLGGLQPWLVQCPRWDTPQMALRRRGMLRRCRHHEVHTWDSQLSAV